MTTQRITPTEEQAVARDLFATGLSLGLEAGAGTGKTSTLLLLADDLVARGQRGAYLAFNKAIVEESRARMPRGVTAWTAHSLGFRATGRRFRGRLESSQRMKSNEVARLLDVAHYSVRYGSQTKRLAPGFLAGHVMRAVRRFCQSADLEPDVQHFPYIDGIDVPDALGRRTYTNNHEVAAQLLPALGRAWADLSDPEGLLRYEHDHYLKDWHLSDPRITADVILFDEAQDANPVMVAIMAMQEHAQVVWVGDSQQAIYEFTGAVNALANVPAEHRAWLTQSFRFGPPIADVANEVLTTLGATLRLKGLDTIDSSVEPLDHPDAILCRTNATAVSTLLAWQAGGRRPHLVGGGEEVARFTRAAAELMTDGRTYHPELACFDSWGQVEDYVDQDPQGGDLKLLVDLISEFGVDTILNALEHMPPEAQADVVISTAHKAKGREWDRVQLAADFPEPTTTDGEFPPADELRLLYVAATRAKRVLDLTAVTTLSELVAPTTPRLRVVG